MSEYGPEVRCKARDSFRSAAALAINRLGGRGISKTSTLSADNNADDDDEVNVINSIIAPKNNKYSSTSSRRTPSKIRTPVDRKLFNALADASAVKVNTPKEKPSTCQLDGPMFFCGGSLAMFCGPEEEKKIAPESIMPEYVPGIPSGIGKRAFNQYNSLVDSDVEDTRQDSVSTRSSENLPAEQSGRDSETPKVEIDEAMYRPASRLRTRINSDMSDLEVEKLTSCDVSLKSNDDDSTRPGSVVSVTVTPPPETSSPAQFKYTKNLFSQFRSSPMGAERNRVQNYTPRSASTCRFTEHAPAMVQTSVRDGRCSAPLPLSSKSCTISSAQNRASLGFTPKSLLAAMPKHVPFFPKKQKHIIETNAALKIQRLVMDWHKKRMYSAIVITQFFKALVCWKNVHTKKIQRVYKRHYARRNRKAIAIQCAWRQKAALLCMKKLASAVVLIQRVLLKRVLHVRTATCIVQRKWRSTLDKIHFLKLLQCNIKLQSYARKWACQQQLCNAVKAAVTMQTFWRNSQAQSSMRRIVRRMFDEECRAAMVVQSFWLSKSQRRQYLALRVKLVTLQTVIRRFVCQHSYCNLKSTTIKVQQSYRAHSTRRNNAAVVIQSCVRKWLAVSQYVMSRQSIVRIQNYYRGLALYNTFTIKRQAACTIQEHFREWSTRKELERQALQSLHVLRQQYIERQLLAKNTAATKIQTCWKEAHAKKAAKDLALRNMSATTIQKRRRGIMTRTAYKHECMFLQSMRWRREKQRQMKEKKAATTIQKYARRAVYQHRYNLIVRAVTNLQIHIVRFLAVSRAARIVRGLTKFQSIVRGRHDKRRFPVVRACVIKIQSVMRMCLGVRNGEMRREAVLVTQRYCRGYAARSRFQRTIESTIQIQSQVRQWLVKSSFQTKCYVAIFTQSLWRGYIQRQQITHWSTSCTTIQSLVRCFLVRSAISRQVVAAIHYQRLWRGRVCRRDNRTAVRAIRLFRQLIESRKQVEEFSAASKAAVDIFWDVSIDGEGVGVSWPDNYHQQKSLSISY